MQTVLFDRPLFESKIKHPLISQLKLQSITPVNKEVNVIFLFQSNVTSYYIGKKGILLIDK